MIAGLALMLMLAACGEGADTDKYSSEPVVQAGRHVHDGPTSITLYTVVGSKTGSGAHTALLINASERVMFDPAGSWTHPTLPQRYDVFHGMTPKMVDFYVDYHARVTYNVVEQTVVVPPEVAQLVYQRALANRAVPKSFCASDTSRILAGVPGFENIRPTMFPRPLMSAFAEIPGVRERTITDDDDNENHGVLIVQKDDPRATQ